MALASPQTRVAARSHGEKCCGNATPANNILLEAKNAQKGGSCLSF
jgi:hypothetical protein